MMYADENNAKIVGFEPNSYNKFVAGVLDTWEWRLRSDDHNVLYSGALSGLTGADYDTKVIQLTFQMGPLFTYAPNANVINCPGDLRSKKSGNSFAFDSYSGTAYLNGEEIGLAAGAPYVIYKTTHIKQPSDRIVWMEEASNQPNNVTTPGNPGGGGFCENLGLFLFYIGTPPNFTDASWVDFPAVNHVTSSTMGYADGHAEAHKWITPSGYPGSPTSTCADSLWETARFPSLLNP
jgi:hypothetical protein